MSFASVRVEEKMDCNSLSAFCCVLKGDLLCTGVMVWLTSNSISLFPSQLSKHLWKLLGISLG